uniref:Uncharacterized protein n=1 Tax=Crocodylus porosus TaxID=8502 RepID=A0A7M4FMZ0_CROPO
KHLKKRKLQRIYVWDSANITEATNIHTPSIKLLWKLYELRKTPHFCPKIFNDLYLQLTSNNITTEKDEKNIFLLYFVKQLSLLESFTQLQGEKYVFFKNRQNRFLNHEIW